MNHSTYPKVKRIMDLIAPSPSNPVPDPGWLTNVFLKFGEITEEVSVDDVKESKEGRMGKGNIIPFKLIYKTTNARDTNKDTNILQFPQTLIAKYAISSGKSESDFDKGAPMIIDKKVFHFLTVAREGWVFKEMPGGTFSPPKVYHSFADFNEPQSMFVLMEDLRPSAIRLDQYHGAQGGSHLDTVSLARPCMSSKQAWKAAFKEVAITHAKHWNLRNLPKEAEEKLKFSSWSKGKNRKQWETSLMACRHAWNAIDKSEISDRVKNFLTTVYENATFERAIERLNNRPKTLVHGDFHAKNLFWHIDEKSVIMTDFSEVGVGNPLSDLGQYIISDVESEVRRQHEHEVLTAYWNKLTSSGVDPEEYTFSQCWESYKNDSLDRFVWFYPILHYFDYNPKFFHDNIDTFLEDHDIDADEFVLVNGVEMVEETNANENYSKDFKIAG